MAKMVLVVDDYADTRFLMRFLIESEGYQVIEAANGLEAVEMVGKEYPDLVIMDMAMPVMDGIIATRRIRVIYRPDQLPIVAFTATGKAMREAALAAGCNDLISKPVEPSSLSGVLRQYLGNN